ncbi:MAG: hypothetical protein KDJ88_09530 [Bauldia sp.]|nr:hypothetical protein [Bauldia sp.]
MILAAVATGPALAEAWQTYVNERFGTTADVPAGWQAGEPPANGDGLRFTAPDGSASVAVFGSLQTFDTIDETIAIYEAPVDGETITYRHRDDRGLVLSGTRDDRIFYRRWILSCGEAVWNGIAIEYPAAEKKAYDPLVTHMSRSLRPGTGWQVEDCPD